MQILNEQQHRALTRQRQRNLQKQIHGPGTLTLRCQLKDRMRRIDRQRQQACHQRYDGGVGQRQDAQDRLEFPLPVRRPIDRLKIDPSRKRLRDSVEGAVLVIR